MSINPPSLSEKQREIPTLAEMEDNLHDLSSYLAAIVQQYLMRQESKYKLIHDKSLNKRLEEVLQEYPEHAEILIPMKEYKSRIDIFIQRLENLPGLTLEIWE